MAVAAPRSFGAHLRQLREAAGFTQEELATIAGLSVRILGAQNDVMERSGPTFMDHAVRDLRAQVERDARARLGDARFAEAFASGSTCSIDALLEDIDRATE